MGDDNEVVFRFRAEGADLQNATKQADASLKNLAGAHKQLDPAIEHTTQAHFSMRHAMALAGSATGMHTQELMHFYYAITMMPGGIGVAVGAFLMLKSMLNASAEEAEKAKKKLEEVHEAAMRFEKERQAHSIATLEGGEAAKNREELQARAKEIEELQRQQGALIRKEEAYAKALAASKQAGSFGGGQAGVALSPDERTRKDALGSEIAQRQQQYKTLQDQTEQVAKAHREEINMTAASKRAEMEIVMQDLTGLEAVRARIEAKKAEILLAQDAADAETDKAVKLEKQIKLDEKRLELAKLWKEERHEVNAFATELAKSELEIQAKWRQHEAGLFRARNEVVGAVQGQQVAGLLASVEQARVAADEARRNGDEEVGGAIETAQAAKMGRMGIDAQRTLAGQKTVGHSGAADWYKTFTQTANKSRTPAEAEQIQALHNIVRLCSEFIPALRDSGGVQ